MIKNKQQQQLPASHSREADFTTTTQQTTSQQIGWPLGTKAAQKPFMGRNYDDNRNQYEEVEEQIYQQPSRTFPMQQHQQFPPSLLPVSKQQQIERESRTSSLLDHTFSEDSNEETTSQVAFSYPNNERAQQAPPPKGRTLAIITLDVGGGNTDVIQVQEGDDLYLLARAFCGKHNLDEDCIDFIIENIQLQLEKHRKKAFVSKQQLSRESPKFPGPKVRTYQQQPQQTTSQGTASTVVAASNSEYSEASRKMRPQQPSFGQNNQFFDIQESQLQVKKPQSFEHITEEELEDQSVSATPGHSGNVSIRYEEAFESNSRVGGHSTKLQSRQNDQLQQRQSSNHSSQSFTNNSSNMNHTNQPSGRQPPLIQQQQYNQDHQFVYEQAVQQYPSQTQIRAQNNWPQRPQEPLQFEKVEFKERNQSAQISHNQGDYLNNPSQVSDQRVSNQQPLHSQSFTPAHSNIPKKISSISQETAKTQATTGRFGGERIDTGGDGEWSREDEEDTQGHEREEEEEEEEQEDEESLTQVEQRKKIIEQISQKLNLEKRKDVVPQQQDNSSRVTSPKPIIAPQPQYPPSQGRSLTPQPVSQKPPSQKISKNQVAVQDQLKAQKEQFFSSYNQQKGIQTSEKIPSSSSGNPNNTHKYQSTSSPHQQADQSDHYFTISDTQSNTPHRLRNFGGSNYTDNSPSSSPAPLRKSQSNNNLEKFQEEIASPTTELRSSKAQQSYENWHKLITEKQQQIAQPMQKRSVSPGPSGRNQQVSPMRYQTGKQTGSMGGGNTISPQGLSKNKSASLIGSTSNNNKSQVSPNFISSISRQQQSKHSSQPLASHDKLYHQGIEAMERRQRITENQIASIQQKELIGATFHPSISPQSRQLKLQEGVKIENYLIQEGKKHKERRGIAQSIHDEEAIKECHFKPSVSQASLKVLEKPSLHAPTSNQSIHERLYQQGQMDKFIKEEWSSKQFDKLYPFTPDLGPHNPYKNNPSYKRPEIDPNVSIKHGMDENPGDIDRRTGQKLYHPIINKDEVFQKVSSKVDLQDKLIQQELSSRNALQGRQVQPARKAQLGWEELLRNQRQPDHYATTSSRSMTPRGNDGSMKMNQSGISNVSRQQNQQNASQSNSQTGSKQTQEIENILSSSSFQNKKVLIKQRKDQGISNSNNISKSFVQQQNSQIPLVSLDRKGYAQVTNISKGSKPNSHNSSSQSYSKQSQIERSPSSQQLGTSQSSILRQKPLIPVFGDAKLSQKIADTFNQFDSDGDGLISSLQIDISNTDAEVLQIIQNVLYQIDENNLTFDRNQFTHSLCSHHLIFPLKQYFAKLAGEVCDEEITDYDLIRSNISQIQKQSQATSGSMSKLKYSSQQQINQSSQPQQVFHHKSSNQDSYNSQQQLSESYFQNQQSDQKPRNLNQQISNAQPHQGNYSVQAQAANHNSIKSARNY